MTDNLERAKYNLSATAYAAALDEIERLTVPDNTVPWVATLFAQMAEVRAEKDAALAECERLGRLLRYFSVELARVTMRPLLDLLKEAGD